MTNRFITASQVLIIFVFISGCSDLSNSKRGLAIWKGSTSVDPLNDLDKLQGKWGRVPENEKAGKWGDQWLIIEGEVATFDYPAFRQSGQSPNTLKHKLLINSHLEPKAIRFIDLPNSGMHGPYFDADRSNWYKLAGEDLILWCALFEAGESQKFVYRKTKR